MFTERLILRQFRADDIDAYAALSADPEVMRYLGVPGAVGRDEAWRQMAMLVGHWELRGYGMWALELRESGQLIGRTGLHFPEGWPEPEVGWAIAREFWGQGLAHEAAAASLDYAFDVLGWSRVCSLISPGNDRSIRLATRLGERFEREVSVRGQPVSLYAITANEWYESRRQ